MQRDTVQQREHKEHNHSQQKVDESGYILGQDEQVFRDIDLGDDARVVHQARHAVVRRFTVIRHDDVTGEQVSCIVRRILAEESGEDNLHDKESQHRREPCHAERRALVFLLKVTLHEFFKKEHVRGQVTEKTIDCTFHVVNTIRALPVIVHKAL